MDLRIAAAAALLVSCSSRPPPARAPQASAADDLASSPIAAENALPGDPGWQLDGVATNGQLEGYAGAASVNHGEAIDIHVSADENGHTLSWTLYRMGYYQGLGGRVLASGGSVPVSPQRIPAPTATGLMECAWPTTFTIQTDPSWVSGYYLLKLVRDDGLGQYVIFVVRADEHKGAAVVQASMATWQAYNDWQGESLYVDALGLSNAKAKEVSFDRPYIHGSGAGEFFAYGEQNFVQWVESRGYDVTYVSNLDVDRNPALLAGQRLFISSGHDEYWSRNEKTNVLDALSKGTNIAFFSANSAYWQIRLEPSRTTGAPARTEVCYKEQATVEDPLKATNTVTDMWRSAAVNEPENAWLGVMYEAWMANDAAWVATNTSHWIYAGTGMVDGDSIPGLIGYEADRLFDNGRTPAGITVLAQGPVVDVNGNPSQHNATIYTAPSGAFVFAAGTIHWAFGLSAPGYQDPRAQVITDNILQHAGLSPAASAGPQAARRIEPAARGDYSAAASAVRTLAGAAGQAGLVDGPLDRARFNRPSALAVDANGALYIADTGNGAIRSLLDGAVSTIATGLAWPGGVAAGADGTVYAADTGNNRILQLVPGGAPIVLAGSPAGTAGLADGQAALFNAPMGLLAMPDGTLLVADSGNNRVCQIAPDGTVTTVLGGSGPGIDDGPQVVPSDGAGLDATLSRPSSLALGGGALWVLEWDAHQVRRVELDGTWTATTVAGSPRGGFADGPAAAALFRPNAGLAWLDGALYVADSCNDRVRRLEGGRVTTFAGAGRSGSADGAGPGATFSMPMGLAALPDSTLVVADEGSSTLRLISP